MQNQGPIVAKFGGTSMAQVPNMFRCANIVINNPKIKVVVVSATAGTTNQLLMLVQKAVAGEWVECEKILRQIKNRHLLMCSELSAPLEFLHNMQQQLQYLKDKVYGIYLLREASPRTRDAILSFGERLSSEIFTLCLQVYCRSHGLKAQHFDVGQVMRTDDSFGEATPFPDRIRQLCEQLMVPLFASCDVLVTQGFIGQTEYGETTTLGRGGSDYSAALLAEALQAQVLQIWTDVPGISTTDPRVIPQAHSLEEITYTEAAELANLGAKVLHPLTLIPVLRQNIPVFVGSSFHLDAQGTWIREHTRTSPFMRAMACRPSQSILTLMRIKRPDAYGFLARIFSILGQHKISVDLISTSEISTSMTLHNPQQFNSQVLDELSQWAEVQWETEYALISLIGPDMVTAPGISSTIFASLSDFAIRFICMGSGKNNISFLVHQRDALAIMQRLHGEFLELPLSSEQGQTRGPALSATPPSQERGRPLN